jgi:ankyrin repeat protein
LRAARVLLDKEAKVDAADSFGRTPLMWAASECREEAVALLLGRSADVNAATSTGWTALRYAQDRGHEEVAALLRLHGAE